LLIQNWDFPTFLLLLFINGLFGDVCRHGLKQYRNGWVDGPAYVTQCPIQTGSSYTYDFNVTGQRGTLWWHAHILWLRATVYGAFVIMPKPGIPFPFPQPHQELEVVFGEFLSKDTSSIYVKEQKKPGNFVVWNVSNSENKCEIANMGLEHVLSSPIQKFKQNPKILHASNSPRFLQNGLRQKPSPNLTLQILEPFIFFCDFLSLGMT